MVFCRIIVVIMPKPIRKITLKMLFSVPCCDSQQIFSFSWLTHSAIKTFNSKEVESGNGILQNHCSHNAKANSKDDSENAHLLAATFNRFFFLFSWLSKVTHSGIKTFNSKEVESGNSVLQNHCCPNAKANSKDSSDNGLLCSLLWHSKHFFWMAINGNT